MGNIAQQFLNDRAAHDKTAVEWTRRYAQGDARVGGDGSGSVRVGEVELSTEVYMGTQER